MPEIEHTVAEGKIRQALTRLGISFMDAMSIVSYDPSAETAYWAYNEDTGRNWICVGPAIAAMDISSIEMALRHEFLHRATYNGFNERFPDQQLLNIVEDVCINRLLYEAYPDKMEKLSRQVYTEESRKTVIALPDCTADPAALDPMKASLWRYIWERDERGQLPPLSPSSLYYRLVEIRQKLDIEIELTITIPVFAPHDSPPDSFSAAMESAIETVLSGVAGRLPGTSESGQMMNTFLNTTFQFDPAPIRNFLDKLNVEMVVSSARTDLVETIHRTFNAPYSIFPSRRGLTFLITGISDLIGLYNNTETLVQPQRLKLCFYVDVSGSMSDYFSMVHYFVKAVFDIPLAVRVFDTNIREISVTDYEAGNFAVGGGTDFDIVVQDLVNDDAVGAGLLFTDGEADVSKEHRKLLRDSGKPVFVVYFVSQDAGRKPPESALNELAARILVMPVKT